MQFFFLFVASLLLGEASAAPCVCENSWTSDEDGGTCGETQNGCPALVCDGEEAYDRPWCIIVEPGCDEEEQDEGGGWAYCEPPYLTSKGQQCPLGYAIDTKEECENDVMTKYDFVGEISKSNRPFGCFLTSRNKKYYNSAPPVKSKVFKHTRAICKDKNNFAPPAPEFTLTGSKKGRNCDQDKVIEVDSECKKAASALGKSYKKSVTSKSRPAGCYYKGGKAWFNTHTTVYAKGRYKGYTGVCKIGVVDVDICSLSGPGYQLNTTTLPAAVADWMLNETIATATYGDISCWNTAEVTSFEVPTSSGNGRGIFQGNSGEFKAFESFNADLSKWDTSKVTNMKNMFMQAKLFIADLSKWDTSKVTDMSGMFRKAEQFTADLSKWDTSNVTTMKYMFKDAKVFNADLSKWDVSEVTDMKDMFISAPVFNCGSNMFTSALNLTAACNN